MDNTHTAGTDTFAVYLAKQYIAKKGFTPGSVPEADALVEASDIVLTLSDGMTFQIVCIIDSEAHPGKQFTLPRDTVDAIGKDCLKYSGTVNSTQLPVTIQIIEAGNQPIGNFDSDRLKGMKRKSLFSKVHIHAWIVDTSSSACWTNAPFKGGLIGRPFIEKVLREPRATEEELQPVEAAMQEKTFPYLTCALLAILAAVFVGEQVYAIGPTTGLLAPSVRTLVALGGLTYDNVMQGGEWYRIFSATLLHGDLMHLVLNGIALFMAGMVLENLVGRAWFLALFVIGAVSGSLMSLAINPHTIVSVGASGAIMGLLTGAFVCSFRFPIRAGRSRIQMNLLQMLIPSLIPLAVRSGQHIDFGAHLGGALSGLLVGLAMMKTWPVTQPLPRFTRLATTIAFAGLAAFAFAATPITRHYGAYVLDTMLVPRDQWPKSTEEGKQQSADLVKRYPRDPRVHFLHASTLLASKDTDGAEHELRTALEEKELLQTKFSPDLQARMQTMLALVLLDKGQGAEAKAAALEVCGKSAAGQMRDVLVKNRLCE